MSVTVQLAYLAAALTWSGLFASLVIARYIGMGRSVYELVSKGDLGVAVVNIEDSKLIPALVELIEMVVTARDQKILEGQDVSYAEILDEVEYRPAMTRAQQAQTSVRDLEVAVDTLRDSAMPIWLIGAFHIGTVMGAAIDQIVASEAWRLPLLFVFLTAAVLSLLLDAVLVVRFEYRHNVLLRDLGSNRGH